MVPSVPTLGTQRPALLWQGLERRCWNPPRHTGGNQRQRGKAAWDSGWGHCFQNQIWFSANLHCLTLGVYSN